MALPPSLASNPFLRTRSSSPAARERVGLSASASSAAEAAALVSPFPSKPKRENGMRVVGTESVEEAEKGLFSDSTRRTRPTRFPPLRHLLRRLRRTPRHTLALLTSTLLLLFLLSHLLPPTLDLLHMWHYKLIDHAYDHQWGWPLAPRCLLRKRPVVFGRGGEGKAAFVWETNGCGEGEGRWKLRWRRAKDERGTKVEEQWRTVDPVEEFVLRDEEGGGERVVYTGAVEGLSGTQTYAYELARCPAPAGSCTPVARGSFPWLGPPIPAPQPAPSRPTTIHIACVADNQFNLRVFRRILLRLRSLARSHLPASYFLDSPPAFPLHAPHLILHAGDAVQNPHNLAQWQTDFWDPLTRTFSTSSSSLFTSLFRYRSAVTTSTLPPVLLARGNHDWDLSGQNLYTGGLVSPHSPLRADYASYLSSLSPPAPQPDEYHSLRGTYFSYSPHPRFRILVLDSNLPTLTEQEEQERWLVWELGREKWRKASVRSVVVHMAPWIEWWDRRAWTEGGESEWSSYVRRSLMPLLALHNCTLILSGHSHAYTRGFLPYSLVSSFSSAANSSSLAPSTLAAARSASTFEGPEEEEEQEPGMLLITFGGAGGTLDSDRVEEWGFMDESVSGRYHFGWMAARFAGNDEGGEPNGVERALEREVSRRQRGLGKGERSKVFYAKAVEECVRGRKVRDVLEWRAVGVEGKEVDRVWLVSEGCAGGS